MTLSSLVPLCLIADSHLLGLPAWELGVAQTHQAEDVVTIVGQAKGKLVGPLGGVPVGLQGAGALSAKGGGQLYEG